VETAAYEIQGGQKWRGACAEVSILVSKDPSMHMGLHAGMSTGGRYGIGMHAYFERH
jgi:hypothetical protein